MVTPTTITSSNFAQEVVQANGPVLIDFWAPWCGPCRLVAPVVEEIATEYAGRLTVGKLNIDEHPAVAQRYGITGIPALLFLHQGQVIDTVVGAVPKRILQKHVEEVLSRTSTRRAPPRLAPSH